MGLTISNAIAWILFLALFPMAFIWLRRAYRIFIKRDYSEVALKRGEAPPHPEKWAPFTGIVNLAAGGVAAWVIVGVLLWVATGIRLGPFIDYKTWSAVVGVTLWMKVFADYIISRQAHPWIKPRARKNTDSNAEASRK